MKRRQVLTVSAGAALAGAVPSAFSMQAGPPKRALMKLGCQSGPTDDRRLQFFKRHSVEHICGYPEDPGNKGYYSVEDLSRLRDRCERNGVSLDMIAPSFLASTHIDRTPRPAIMLGQSPDRDRDIEHVQNMIRNCAKAGVPAIKYNMSILGVLRTERTPGRGGSTYSTWRLKEAKTSG
ncbi:MAG: mannonate dehydratase, partial [Bryobacteraceae bacterium]|nr:mannonate dehydratase [Bryobacteraceae bacterium]